VPHAPSPVLHAPLGPLGAAGFPGLRHELPRLARPLAVRLHVALAFPGHLADDMWVQLHVTHLLSVPLMDDTPRRGVRVRRAQLAARAGASRGAWRCRSAARACTR